MFFFQIYCPEGCQSAPTSGGCHPQAVFIRAAESESRPDLESVGVGHFDWGQSQLESANMADSDSGPESQAITCQQTMILGEQLSILPKTLKDMKKRRVALCR